MINGTLGFCRVGEEVRETIPGRFPEELFAALGAHLPWDRMSLVLHRADHFVYHILACPDGTGKSFFGIFYLLNGLCLAHPEDFLKRALVLADRLSYGDREVTDFRALFEKSASPIFREKMLSLRSDFESEGENWEAEPLETFDYGSGRGDVLVLPDDEIDAPELLSHLQGEFQKHRFVIFPLTVTAQKAELPETPVTSDGETEPLDEVPEAVPEVAFTPREESVPSVSATFPERTQRPYAYSHSDFAPKSETLGNPEPVGAFYLEEEKPPERKSALGYFWTCYTSKFLDFGGKASRKEVWSFLVLTAAVYFALQYYPNYGAKLSPRMRDYLIIGINAFVGLAAVFPLISLLVRRLHDLRLSGWMLFLVAVLPVIVYGLKLWGEIQMIIGLLIASAFVIVLVVKMLFSKGDL